MTPFEAVAEPARRALLDALVNGPKTVAVLGAATGLSQPNTSRHLRILREAGIVTKRIEGAKGYMSLRKTDLDRRFPGLLDSVLSADLDSVISADTTA